MLPFILILLAIALIWSISTLHATGNPSRGNPSDAVGTDYVPGVTDSPISDNGHHHA